MVGCTQAPNCTVPDDSIVHFAADPDIGGIGVLLAFVISAWLTFLFVVLAYMFISSGIPDREMNHLDLHFTNWTKRLPPWLSTWVPNFAGKHISSEAMQQVVLILSDQQLITGASILIIGYMKHCTITQYHFYIIALLGWISFTCHQPTIMILQDYLKPRPSMRHWRALWMFGLYGMGATAQILTYNNDFLDTYGMSTQCVWDNTQGNYSSQNLVLLGINLFILTWGFLAVLSLLFPGPLGWIGTVNTMAKNFLRSPSRLHNKAMEKLGRKRVALAGLWRDWRTDTSNITTSLYIMSTAISLLAWLVINFFTFFLFLLTFTVSEIIYSVLIDIFRIYASLLWGTILLFRFKWGASDHGMDGSENDWGFGQLLPLLLLILPIVAAWEVVYDELFMSRPSGDTSSAYTDQQPMMMQQIAQLSDEPTSSSIDITDARTSSRLIRRFLPRRLHDLDTEERFPLLPEPDRPRSSGTGDRPVNGENSLEFSLEDAMYRSWLFKLWMIVIISGAFGGFTVAALEGYAF